MMPDPRRSPRWLEQPAEAGAGVRQPEHSETEGCPGERAANGHDRFTAGVLELLSDIGDDAAVGRRGGGEHRDAVRHLGDEVTEATVVRAEVVAPVRNAVGLVDHKQSGARNELRQLFLTESRVVETLGRDEQDVYLVIVEFGEHIAPLVRVRRVDRDGADPCSGGRLDLVAHEREQRRDEKCRPGTLSTEEQRGDEVHGRLAPPGALHDEGAFSLGDKGLDGLVLALVEVGVR